MKREDIEKNVTILRQVGAAEPDKDGTYKLPGYDQDGNRLGEEGVVCSDLMGAMETSNDEVSGVLEDENE